METNSSKLRNALTPIHNLLSLLRNTYRYENGDLLFYHSHYADLSREQLSEINEQIKEMVSRAGDSLEYINKLLNECEKSC